MLSRRRLPYKLNGFVCDKNEPFIELNVDGELKRVPVIGVPSQLSSSLFQKVAAKNPRMVLTLEDERDEVVLQEISRCIKRGIEIEEGGTLYENLTGKIPVEHIREKWLIKGLSKPSNTYCTIKRVFDVIGSVILLIALLPLFATVALLIKLDSKGPVFYRQKRMGKNGREFILNKFRTMVRDAENGTPLWAKKDDPRVTRVGRWLRRLRIDELPQLFNVLKGEMSLVGPRPERRAFVKMLEKSIPFYNYRHIVKPGITGWAQVNYRYANSVGSSLEKLQYDLYGIKHSSFLFDIKVLFKTIWTVLTLKGAH